MRPRVAPAEGRGPTAPKDTDTDSDGLWRPFILDTRLTEEGGRAQVCKLINTGEGRLPWGPAIQSSFFSGMKASLFWAKVSATSRGKTREASA